MEGNQRVVLLDEIHLWRDQREREKERDQREREREERKNNGKRKVRGITFPRGREEERERKRERERERLNLEGSCHIVYIPTGGEVDLISILNERKGGPQSAHTVRTWKGSNSTPPPAWTREQ